MESLHWGNSFFALQHGVAGRARAGRIIDAILPPAASAMRVRMAGRALCQLDRAVAAGRRTVGPDIVVTSLLP